MPHELRVHSVHSVHRWHHIAVASYRCTAGAPQVFVVLFLSLSTVRSMVTSHIEDTKLQLDRAYRKGNDEGTWSPLLLLVVPAIRVCLEAIAKMHLAQVFYTDQAAVGIARVWHKDAQDPPDVKNKREAELRDVAKALESLASPAAQNYDGGGLSGVQMERA